MAAPPPSTRMSFTPPRLAGLLLGFLFLSVLLGGTAYGASQLAAAAISPWIVVWVLLPLLGVPLATLVSYRLYGLLTASYRLDRNGFYLTWGLARDQIPLAELERPRLVRDLPGRWLPRGGLWWPGCVVGWALVEGVGRVDFFAVTPPSGMVLLTAGERHLVISPPHPMDFIDAFTQAIRLGSLESIPAISQRPDFLFNRLWSDRVARLLIVLSLAFSLVLLGYLAVRAPGLPERVAFGFDPAGRPDPWAPPGRLLLLPLIGGLCWLVDLAAGIWLYRRETQRALAYVVWGAAGLVALLLWGAAFHLLSVSGGVGP